MSNFIFKNNNLITGFLTVLLVISCGDPYDDIPKYPTHYSNNYTVKYKNLKTASSSIDIATNKNIEIITNITSTLKSYQTINKVSTEKNIKFIEDASLKLEKINTKFIHMKENNQILLSQIPTATTPADLKNLFLNSLILYHNDINTTEIKNIKIQLLNIFNNEDVIRILKNNELNNVKDQINKLDAVLYEIILINTHIQFFLNNAQ